MEYSYSALKFAEDLLQYLLQAKDGSVAAEMEAFRSLTSLPTFVILHEILFDTLVCEAKSASAGKIGRAQTLGAAFAELFTELGGTLAGVALLVRGLLVASDMAAKGTITVQQHALLRMYAMEIMEMFSNVEKRIAQRTPPLPLENTFKGGRYAAPSR